MLSGDWVETSLVPRTRSPFSGLDYGYGWFLGRPRGRRIALARGYGGQLIALVPDLGLTVVVTSDPTRPARSEGYFGDLIDLIAQAVIPDAEAGLTRDRTRAETLRLALLCIAISSLSQLILSQPRLTPVTADPVSAASTGPQSHEVQPHRQHQHLRPERGRQAHRVLLGGDELGAGRRRLGLEPGEDARVERRVVGEAVRGDDLGALARSVAKNFSGRPIPAKATTRSPAPVHAGRERHERAPTSGRAAGQRPANRGRASGGPIASTRSARASPSATGSRSGPAGITRPLPKP